MIPEDAGGVGASAGTARGTREHGELAGEAAAHRRQRAASSGRSAFAERLPVGGLGWPSKLLGER